MKRISKVLAAAALLGLGAAQAQTQTQSTTTQVPAGDPAAASVTTTTQSTQAPPAAAQPVAQPAPARTEVAVAPAASVNVREERSTARVIFRDTLYGGLTGGVVGGGIIGYKMGIQNEKNYGWGPVLATSVGIGLAAGAVLGIVDAAAGGPNLGDARPARDGLSFQDQHPSDLSNVAIAPVAVGRF